MNNHIIAVYGCGKDSEMFSNFFMRMQLGTIISYIQTKKTVDKFRGIDVIEITDLRWELYDYIVIATSKYVSEIENELEAICPDYHKRKIIYMLDYVNGIKNANDKFSVCSVEGNLHFIFNSTDTVIGPWMWLSGKTDGADIVDYLFEFSDTRGILDKKGIFLDIGANIGTASIYAKYKEPDMEVIAFEPGKDNFNVLKTNCILNNKNTIRLENIGLGSENIYINYMYYPENPGGSRAVKDSTLNSETIEIHKLDDYVADNEIDASRISFIWMDIEGSECDAIVGGIKTLMDHKIPIVHEFNYTLYKEDIFNQYLKIMTDCYNSFIDVRVAIDGDEKVHDILELSSYAEQIHKQTDLFFF